MKFHWLVSLVLLLPALYAEAQNTPPVVVATVSAPGVPAATEITVTLGTGVDFNSTGTMDADGDTLTYKWQLLTPSGHVRAEQITDATTMRLSFRSQTNTYHYRLVVSDGTDSTSSDRLVIRVIPNTRPVAVAVASASGVTAASSIRVPAKARVTLDGSGSSDADNHPLTYKWQQVSGTVYGAAGINKGREGHVTISNGDTATATFKAPKSTTDLYFRLTVNDGSGKRHATTVAIHVEANASASIGSIAESIAVNAGRALIAAVVVAAIITGVEAIVMFLKNNTHGSVRVNSTLAGTDSPDAGSGNTPTHQWQQLDSSATDVTAGTVTAGDTDTATFTMPAGGSLYFGRTDDTGAADAMAGDTVTVSAEDNHATAITQTVLRQALSLATDINSALSERMEAFAGGNDASFALTLDGKESNNAITLWGQLDNRNLSASSGAASWQGDNSSRHLGFDRRLSNRGIAGLLITETEGSFNYKDQLIGGGIIQSNLSGQHPYFGWVFDNGIRLWAALGFGSGSLTVLARQAASRSETGLATTLVGVGKHLTSDGAVRIGIRGEFSSATLDIDASQDGRISAISAGASQFRVTAVGKLPIEYSSGARLTPELDLALRSDSGDGATGTGLELGLKLDYVSASGFLTISGAYRTMLTDVGDYEESGTSLSVRLDTAADGRGLAFRLEPGYGRTQSEADRLWSDSLDDLTEQDASQAEHLSTELSYGVAVPGRRAMLLTPYGRWNQSANGRDKLEYGTRLSFGESFQLSFGATEQYDIRGKRDHRTGLTGEMRF